MKPTEILKQEHRAIERMLDVLETAANRVASGEQVPPQTFKDAIRFIRQFADGCHHHKEETLLFPAMIEKGFSSEAGPIAVMLYEHDAGRALVKGMSDAVESYEKGDLSALSRLVAHSREFTSLLREHINKEDNILFAMADMHLSEEDQAKLSGRFDQAENHNEACALKSDLLDLLNRLETNRS